MALQNVQSLELDLLSGIHTDESLIQVGAGLVRSGECAWAPFGLDDDVRRRSLALLPHRELGLQRKYNGQGAPILAIFPLDTESDFDSGGIVVLAETGYGGFSVVQMNDGSTTDNVAELLTAADSFRPGWAVLWTGIATSTVYFGHPSFAKVYTHLAPGTGASLHGIYAPTTNPLASTGIATDTNLNISAGTISAPSAVTGETALAADTYTLKVSGVSGANKETGVSAATAGTVVGSGKVLAFTTPALPAGYVSLNVYADKGGGGYALQMKGLLPSTVYHLNANGANDPADVAATGIKYQSSGTVMPTGLTLDATKDLVSPAAVNPTPPEQALGDATWNLILTNGLTKSDVASVSTTKQVIRFTTPAAGTQLLLYAAKGSGAYRLQTPGGTYLATSTVYHLNATGGLVQPHAGFTGIAYQSSGAALGGQMPSVVAAKVHLERLWLGQQLLNGRSLVWFTDVLDPTTIRGTNFVAINGTLTSIFRCSVSSVDVGAVSHLCFGSSTAIDILDGDPTLGTAVLRRLSASVGIADGSCVTETQYGAVLLGTDGQFYLIPPSATALIPLGHRTLAQNFAYDLTATRASLAWASPYVLYCPADRTDVYYLDLRPLANNGGVMWWGPAQPGFPDTNDPIFPLVNPVTNAAVGHSCIRLFGVGAESGPTEATRTYLGWISLLTLSPTPSAYLDAIVRGSPGTVDSRQATIITGLMTVPDHKIELRRVILEVLRASTASNITLTAIRDDGTTTVVVGARPTTAAEGNAIISKLRFDFGTVPIVSDGIRLELDWDAAQSPDLLRAHAKIIVQPRED